MEQFTIRDFSGGLNTAIDPASLPPNMSPHLANVDLLDSKAIKKRDGFVIDTASPMPGGVVDSLYRYYKKDGSKYWVSVCASGLFSRVYNATDTAATTHEAENLTPSGGSVTTKTRTYASGGRTVALAATAHYILPESTAITIRSNAGPLAGAYIAIDGGAEVLATTQTYTVAGLDLEAHTVSIRPQARTAKALAVTAAAGSKCGYQRDTGANRLLSASPNDTVSMRFWDNGTTDPTGTWGLAFGPGGTYQRAARYQVYRDGLASVYRYWPSNSDEPYSIFDGSYQTVPISEGWHTVKLENSRIYLDDVDMGNCPINAARNVELFVDATATGSPALTAYFDTLMLNGVLVDDGDATTGWTQVGTETYHDSVGTFSIASTAARFDTATVLEVDAFQTIGTTLFEHIGSVTATSDTFGFTTLNDKCYISSPYNQLMSFTGATLATVTATNTPAVGFLVQKGERLFGAGNAADPTKLYYTELDDPEDWGVGTQNGIYLAGKDAGGGCNGLAVWSDMLFYFSESKTWALDTAGTPDKWAAKELSSSHGCVAPKSIAVAPNAVIFLSSDGVRAYGTAENIYSDDGSLMMLLSDNINPTLNAYTFAERQAARGAVFKNRYWLSIANDTYVCDLEKRTEQGQPPWTSYTGLDINALAVTRSDEYGLYAGSKTTGHIYQLDTGKHDNGAAISMVYETPPFAPKGYTTVKHLKHLHLAAKASKPSALSVEFSTDDVSPPDNHAVLTEATDRRPVRMLIPGRGRSASLRMSTSGANQDVTISELTVTYNPVPRVR